MNKKLLLIAGLLMSFISFSQITITADNVIGASEEIDRVNDDVPSIVHTDAGENQTWNYENLNSSNTFKYALGNSNWFDGHENFPEANLANNEDGMTLFYRKNENAMDIMGVYGDFTEDGEYEAINFEPYQRLVEFPSTYGSEFTNTTTMELVFEMEDFEEFDSIMFEQTSVSESFFDAWGEITTPFGTFETIRQELKVNTQTRIIGFYMGFPVPFEEMEENTLQYLFWSNDEKTKYPVLEYFIDEEFGTLTNVIWLGSETTVSNEDIKAQNKLEDVKIHPNPTTDIIHLTNVGENDYYTIVDMSGRVITEGKLEVGITNKISLEGYDRGIYNLMLKNNSKGTYLSRRVVKQ